MRAWRACILAGVAAASVLAGIDVYIFLSRTDDMAAVSVPRLFFSIVFQAAGGVLFALALAGGALHYSNCARWDFNRGVMCGD